MSSMRDWQKLHQEAIVADLHSHPMLKATLFRRDMGAAKFGGLSKICKLAFWPPAVRSNFPKMVEGGLDISLSTVYIPEKGWFEDLPILNLVERFNHLTRFKTGSAQFAGRGYRQAGLCRHREA